MSRNCPQNQHAHKKESRPTRHKAHIAPNTALYEILELDKESAEEAFVTETDVMLPIANVQFVGMTIMNELNLDEKRRQIIQKINGLFAGLSISPGRVLTDTAAQAPTIGSRAEGLWRRKLGSLAL